MSSQAKKPTTDELLAAQKAISETPSYAKAAQQLGITVGRLTTLRKYISDEQYAESKSGNRPFDMSEEYARLVIAVWKQYKCESHVAARALQLSASTFRRRVAQAQNIVGEVSQEEIAQAKVGDEPQRSLADEVTLRKAKSDLSYTKSRLADATDELLRLQSRLSDLETVVRSDAQPAEWTLNASRPGRSEHIPMLFTSDFQIGEVIRPEETEHAHGYSTEIFRKRYRQMIETTIYLSFEHVSADWHYPGIVYARGGDTVSGAIHDELAETDDVTPIRAVEVAFEEESAGIRKLAEAFGRVDVKDCGGGNHDRITKKPRAKKAWSNLDRLVRFMLEKEFKDDDRIHFQTTESMDVYFPIYKRNYLLTHGDRIGSRGGQGFVGPAATIMRGAQKVIQEQQALGRHVDCVMMGHFHTPLWYDWVLVNGSFPGYSEFAKQNRMRPHDPQQWLIYHHENHGVVDLKPIILTDTSN